MFVIAAQPTGLEVRVTCGQIVPVITDRHEKRYTMLPTPKIEKGPGIRGQVIFFVKRVIRRSSRWYVEPRFDEIRSISEDLQRSVVFLRKELELSQRQIAQISLRLHELEKSNSSSR